MHKTMKSMMVAAACLAVGFSSYGGTAFVADLDMYASVNGAPQTEISAGGSLTVVAGSTVTLTGEWLVNKDVTDYRWNQEAWEEIDEAYKKNGATSVPFTANVVGQYTYTFQISHHAQPDRTAAISITINVIQPVTYGMNGLFPPYSPDKAYEVGSSIPLKWQITGNEVVIDSQDLDVRLQVIRGEEMWEAPETLPDAGDSGWQYDVLTYTHHYNWKTTGFATGSYIVKILLGSTTLGEFPVELK